MTAPEQITRFSPYAVDGGADAYGQMEEDIHGDYVNFEDHAAMLATLSAENATLRAEIYAQIEAMPRREELLGGQRTQYVQLHEVLAWIGAKP